MSTSTPAAPTSTTASAVATAAQGPLTTSHGKTVIADTVVSKIAGITAREVHGVYVLDGSASRAVGHFVTGFRAPRSTTPRHLGRGRRKAGSHRHRHRR